MKYVALFAVVVLAGWGCGDRTVTEQKTEETTTTETSSTSLDVPFTSQAPDANWAEPWKNACEETSVVMVDAFYRGENEPEVSIEAARERILAVFDTKRDQLQLESKDESMETVVELIDALELNWRAEVVSDPSLEDMKAELADGRPIIVPVYAPKLNNPYYTDGGPDYHVMVIVGYDEDADVFIVHDPGTQFGEDLMFSYDTIIGAIHDLTLDTNYTEGEKKVLFTKKNSAFIF